MLVIIVLVFNLLKHGNFQYQMKTWGKALLASLVFSSVCSSYIYAIYSGYFWFLFGVIAVMVNDVMAYFFGVLFGRTPLIKLSPKKTWEGFIGGIFGTFVWCFFTSSYLCSLKFLVCPQPNIHFDIFQPIDCETPHTFRHELHHIDLGPLGSFDYDIAPV